VDGSRHLTNTYWRGEGARDHRTSQTDIWGGGRDNKLFEWPLNWQINIPMKEI